MAPSSTLHPPTVTISTRAALASSRRITVTRVACTTGLSRLGCVTITPGCASGTEDITAMTIQARVAGVRGGRGPGAFGSRPVRCEGSRGRGGIGRHAGLRSRWALRPWGFESLRPHFRLRDGVPVMRYTADVPPTTPRIQVTLDSELAAAVAEFGGTGPRSRPVGDLALRGAEAIRAERADRSKARDHLLRIAAGDDDGYDFAVSEQLHADR